MPSKHSFSFEMIVKQLACDNSEWNEIPLVSSFQDFPSKLAMVEGGIRVRDECAPYLGLWVNSLVGFSILSSFSISKIDLFLILPNAPHTRVRADCREFKLRLHLPQVYFP